MNSSQTTRRSFLANMAIVSAGAAFHPLIQFLDSDKPVIDLKQQWNIFCNRNGGILLTESFVAESVIRECKGHRHQVGQPVCFTKENLLAQPTWIFWKEEGKVPDDVVVSFFENGGKKKLFRLNRFELESINNIHNDKEGINYLALAMQGQRLGNLGNKPMEALQIRTKVTKRNCSSVVSLSTRKTTIENKFIHNI